MEVSRLLVLGPDHDSTLAVISKLRHLCGELPDDPQDATNSDVVVLNMQTKYYRALVEVHVHQVLNNTPEPVMQYELHDYEALVCVMDAGQRESFLHVNRFSKRIVDTVPYDVCLFAVGTSSATKESVKKMESWCQDNSFEFVDLDDDEPLAGDDDVIHEKRGIERVLEALHCNMWRSMEMESQKVETSATVRGENVTPEMTVAADETEKKTNDQEEKKENNSLVAAEDDQTDAAVDDSRLQVLLQALEIAGPDTKEGDAVDDVDMAQFSALISEVRNVRDQGESLTDVQRRERAAEVAMKLWSFLGEDDEASDSD